MPLTAKGAALSLRLLAKPAKAKFLQHYFKTGRGEYGEGDVFIGVTVPEQRRIARKYQHLSFQEVGRLLKSKIHEYRYTALLILDTKFLKSNEIVRKQVFTMVVQHTRFINNWDLVDTTAPIVVGNYLLTKPRRQLYELARSKDIWERRIAIIATQTFIRRGQFTDTLALAKILLTDQHDLMHKAVGWMLREVGDRDRQTEERFLHKYAATMPRTMLRYAMEKFPARLRQQFLHR